MRSVLIKLKKIFLLLFGFLLLVMYLIRGGYGLRRFYINAQIKNGLERAFLEHFSLSFLFNNYALFKSEKYLSESSSKGGKHINPKTFKLLSLQNSSRSNNSSVFTPDF